MPYSESAEGVEEPEKIADPKSHDHDHDAIQYRLDGPLH